MDPFVLLVVLVLFSLIVGLAERLGVDTRDGFQEVDSRWR
jgi:hypothetical protein